MITASSAIAIVLFIGATVFAVRVVVKLNKKINESEKP
jgi:hypothetical protein